MLYVKMQKKSSILGELRIQRSEASFTPYDPSFYSVISLINEKVQ